MRLQHSKQDMNDLPRDIALDLVFDRSRWNDEDEAIIAMLCAVLGLPLPNEEGFIQEDNTATVGDVYNTYITWTTNDNLRTRLTFGGPYIGGMKRILRTITNAYDPNWIFTEADYALDLAIQVTNPRLILYWLQRAVEDQLVSPDRERNELMKSTIWFLISAGLLEEARKALLLTNSLSTFSYMSLVLQYIPLSKRMREFFITILSDLKVNATDIYDFDIVVDKLQQYNDTEFFSALIQKLTDAGLSDIIRENIRKDPLYPFPNVNHAISLPFIEVLKSYGFDVLQALKSFRSIRLRLHNPLLNYTGDNEDDRFMYNYLVKEVGVEPDISVMFSAIRKGNLDLVKSLYGVVTFQGDEGVMLALEAFNISDYDVPFDKKKAIIDYILLITGGIGQFKEYEIRIIDNRDQEAGDGLVENMSSENGMRYFVSLVGEDYDFYRKLLYDMWNRNAVDFNLINAMRSDMLREIADVEYNNNFKQWLLDPFHGEEPKDEV